MGAEAVDFVRKLAWARARSQPVWLRASTMQAYIHRWTGVAAIAAQKALAASLLELPGSGEDCMDGDAPAVHDVIADARAIFPVYDSRLPTA